MSRNAETDPNAPVFRVVRHLVVHFAYLALSVAAYFVMAALGVDVKIHVYFLVVLLAPAVFWLAVLSRRKVRPQDRQGEEES